MLDNYSLEKEFRIYADIHKFRIVKGQLTTYYRDLDETGVTLPDFMRGGTPEEKAEMMTSDLFCSNPVGFETMYNVDWAEHGKFLI